MANAARESNIASPFLLAFAKWKPGPLWRTAAVASRPRHRTQTLTRTGQCRNQLGEQYLSRLGDEEPETAGLKAAMVIECSPYSQGN
jgi:hypothetical protein